MGMAWIVPRPRKDGCVSYRVEWRDGAKQRVETYKSKKVALQRKHEIEHEKDVGTYRDPSLGKVTFGEFLAYVTDTSPGIAPTTRALYEMHARLYLLPSLGEVPLNAI